MSDLTDVRKTMANEVREQEKRAARQSKAFVRNEDFDVNKLAGKDPDQRRGRSARDKPA
jgi:hypothetical protein